MQDPGDKNLTPTQDYPALTPLSGLTPEQEREVLPKVYEMYLKTDMRVDEIGVMLDIPAEAISNWADKYKWRDRKIALAGEMFRDAEARYREFVTKEKLQTAKRHLNAASLVETLIVQEAERLTQEPGVADSRDLKRLAEALSSVTAVSARAVGLNETTVKQQESYGGGNGKSPLILMNITPSRPDYSHPVIDIKEVKEEKHVIGEEAPVPGMPGA